MDQTGEIEALMEQMSLPEKVSLLAGQDFWSLPGLERLNIQSLKMADGPTGLRSDNSEPATVFPVGIALAASWDRQLVQSVSSAIAREALSHGIDVLLAPGINIQRVPIAGRNFEYFSEDPHLSEEMGVSFVDGVQSQGVGACLKHLVANNQEHNRMFASSNVSDRALREVYLSAFEGVVKRANPWTVMSAYNKVNGTFASEHKGILTDALKTDWAYDGVVVSDWAAAKSTIASANAGLDVEMPGPARFYGQELLRAIESGAVREAILDDHVHRVLNLYARCGLLGRNQKVYPSFDPRDENRDLAAKAAENSIVLLKNENATLPLEDVQRVAVIGAFADFPAIQGGGSSRVCPDRIITPLEGLRSALGDGAEICFERGVDPEPRPPTIDGRLLMSGIECDRIGLDAKYYATTNWSGDIVHEEIDWRFSKVGFGAHAQEANGAFSVEWSGFFVPRYSGNHDWLISHTDGEVQLTIDDVVLVGADTHREIEPLYMILKMHKRAASADLKAGQKYPIRIRYSQPSGIPGFNMLNISVREPAPDRQAAIRAAESADKTILFIGPGTTSESEGSDRSSMAIDDEQTELLEDIVRVNPNTIVVANIGGPVEMPWESNVPAIVSMWLPGQEGGSAIARVLTGKVNPSGKLPITFPRRYKDNPSAIHYPGGEDVEYGEGLFVGYKYYDAIGIDPLFPFGHGLSYTRFEYGILKSASNAREGDGLLIELDVKNIGDREGAETVQFYVSDKATTETMVPRQLRAFEKVHLHPGETTTIVVELNARAFAHWNRLEKAWRVTPGQYVIHAGGSSRDLRQSISVEFSA